MKALQTIFRLSTLLRPQFATLKTKINPTTLTVGTLATSYAMYYGSQKILTEEVSTYEIDDNLQDGEMKEVQVGPKVEDTVLVMKYQGEYYCTQSKCSHFGFSLAKGTLVGDKIMCPLHNAGFDVKTGQPEQGPVMDGLKTFSVKRSNGKVVISVPKTGWQNKPEKPVLG